MTPLKLPLLRITDRELVFLACVISLALITRTYAGIWHDAILYTAQAIRHINPTYYADDLFFLYGSQDQYTLFSNLYSLTIQSLGIDDAARLLTLLGQILWIAGALLLARKQLPESSAWLAVAAIFVFIGCYSGENVFIVRESFITPRLWAEGLSLLALAALLHRNFLTAAALIFSALVLHPLNAMAALMVVYFMLMLSRPRLAIILATAAILAICALATAGIPPASALFQPIDEEWFNLTVDRSPHLYISYLDKSYWNNVALTMATLATVALHAQGNLRQFTRATFLTVATGILLAWWASESLSSLLLIQLQTWRVVWLGMVVAMMGSVWMAWETIHRRLDPIPILGLIVAWLFLDSMGWIIAGAAVIYSTQASRITPNAKRYVMGLVIGLLLIGGLPFISLEITYLLNTLPVQLTTSATTPIPPLVTLVCIICLAYASKWPSSRAGRTVIATVSLAAFITSALFWDRQTPNTLLSSHDAVQLGELQKMIAIDENVYWGREPYGTWFLLYRPSYYSGVQGAGAIFNRETARESYRRSRVLSGVEDEPDKAPDSSRIAALDSRQDISLTELAMYCRDPHLHWLVLGVELPGWAGVYSRDEGKSFFYRCADYRQ